MEGHVNGWVLHAVEGKIGDTQALLDTAEREGHGERDGIAFEVAEVMLQEDGHSLGVAFFQAGGHGNAGVAGVESDIELVPLT